jgi:methylmalonyl-CoA mutase
MSDVRKQVRRNRVQFDGPDEDLPIYLTSASDFNDPGTNRLYGALVSQLNQLRPGSFKSTIDLPLDDAN